MKGFDQLLHIWRVNPVRFIQDVVGYHLTQEELTEKGKLYGTKPGPIGKHYLLDPLQVDILQSIADLAFIKWKVSNDIPLHEVEKKLVKTKGVSTMAGKGCGKTAIASLVALWYLICYDQSKVLLVGPKYDQIKKGLFPEIGKWISRSLEVYGEKSELKRLLDVGSEEILYKDGLDKAVRATKHWSIKILTFNPGGSIEEQKAKIAGIHTDNMLFIMDEAPGIPNLVFDAIDETCTQPNNIIFNIFNPNKNTGWAIDAHSPKMKDYWITHQINCQNSSLVTKEHIEYMAHKVGRDSNIFRVNVLGLPPLTDDGSFISYEWVERAVERYEDYEPEPNAPVILSLDVGGGGDDSIVAIMKGRKLLQYERNTSPNTEIVAAWYEELINDWQPDEIYVDKVGIGHGVYDKLMTWGCTKLKGIAGNASPKSDKFYCLRDELGYKLREALQEGDLYLPPDDDLKAELSILQEDPEHSSNKFKLVSKKNAAFIKEMRGKLGYKSPNKLDALMMCFYNDYKVVMRKKERLNPNRNKFHSVVAELDRYAWMAG